MARLAPVLGSWCLICLRSSTIVQKGGWVIWFLERTVRAPFTLQTGLLRTGDFEENVICLDSVRLDRGTFSITGFQIKLYILCGTVD